MLAYEPRWRGAHTHVVTAAGSSLFSHAVIHHATRVLSAALDLTGMDREGEGVGGGLDLDVVAGTVDDREVELAAV